MATKTADRSEIRYRVGSRYSWGDAPPRLEQETWVRGPKKAKRLEGGRGYSIYTHAEMDSAARTPEEALEKYRAQVTKARDRLATELLEAEATVAVATRAKIIDGKLVL